MNNINILYRSKCSDTLSSLLNNAATTVYESCDNSQYKLSRIANINNNVNTCSCMLHLVLLQVVFLNSYIVKYLQLLKIIIC